MVAGITSSFTGGNIQLHDSNFFFRESVFIFLEIFIVSQSNLAGRNYVDLPTLIVMADSLDLIKNSTISSSYIALFSKNQIDISANIISNIPTCSYEDLSQSQAKFFDFILHNRTINILASYQIYYQNSSMPLAYDLFSFFVVDILRSNFTILLVSEDVITINANYSIQGSTIGIFAGELDVFPNAAISTELMGCGEFQGPGKGTKIFNAQYECGGNGGNYGGFQGYGLGADLDKSELCKQFATDFAVKYGDPFYPKYQGAGGGGHEAGYGGGVIFISSLSSIMVDGVISSDGESLLRDKCNAVNGSGAGSGGSVQIYSMGISGSGTISANGGDAFNYCGEGGGGRIMVFFYNWERNSNIQSMWGWTGTISVKSGARIIDLASLKNISIANFLGTEGSNSLFHYFFLFIRFIHSTIYISLYYGFLCSVWFFMHTMPKIHI